MSPSLRVLLITGEYPPMEGGVADFTAILADRMATQGAHVQVLTSVSDGAPDATITVHRVMRHWDALSLWRALARLRRDFDPQVVDIQYQTAAFGMRPAINLLPYLVGNLPCVATFHDLKTPYLFPKAGRVREWVNHELARRCRAVITTNAEDLATLRSWPGISRRALIPIGSNITPSLIEESAGIAWRRQRHIADSALVLCYFGFLNASKGGEELIAALDALVRSGRNVWLIMIGSSVGASDITNASYLARVRRTIATRGLEDRVLWTGYLTEEQVSVAFSAADLCVLPYRDGLSFRRGSLMAALAHGLPIVSTQPQTPLPELKHGANVWLTPPADVDALVAAITRLADDPVMRRQLGEGARALARYFDWDAIAAQTLTLLSAVATPGEA